MSKLTGHRAVITGGGTGIGLACARSLAAQGAQVIIMGRDLVRLEAAAQTIPGAQAIQLDVTDADSVTAAFAKAAAGGAIDILVNNAGIVGAAAFHRTSMEEWQRIQAVNVEGLVRCTQAVIGPMMKSAYGRIVNIASIAGLRGGAYIAPYVASKHAVVGLTKSLSIEYAGTAVTFNAVCPGYVETAIVDNSVANIMAKTGRSREDALSELTKTNPQGRLIQPEEVAETVAWLCSPLSGSVSGQAITISGGAI
ncbi:SDR family NAD(P)-dependent oxidoreductase [Maricaulis salignorans]|uniref:NADP-dependent 3-hydroxy acid dehydrogenase YdfG n=1 Tax=Maricaulis salignorans TaxID=144026 RepID=A0A1G9P525_9PROT|nr:SDR family NAD(P)-dependent oxidoreductase [Maricaulis salignorans]SDL93611.1 NADP-dependent 3-hydroxy acid dehydrogenase YdfG [Maricaulis salignorans]